MNGYRKPNARRPAPICPLFQTCILHILYELAFLTPSITTSVCTDPIVSTALAPSHLPHQCHQTPPQRRPPLQILIFLIFGNLLLIPITILFWRAWQWRSLYLTMSLMFIATIVPIITTAVPRIVIRPWIFMMRMRRMIRVCGLVRLAGIVAVLR